MHVTPSYPRSTGVNDVRQVSWLMVIAFCTFPYINTVVHCSLLPFTVAGPRWSFTNFPFKKLENAHDSASPNQTTM
jgi:hypothetical protein